MTQVTVTKIDAAVALLNRAIAVFLDHADYLSAVVLGGSAEDVLQGLLARGGHGAQSARAHMAVSAKRIAESLDPSGGPVSEKDAVNLMRGLFNWLRHADSPTEPSSIDWHTDIEARVTIYRALHNLDALGGPNPPRAAEFIGKVHDAP